MQEIKVFNTVKENITNLTFFSSRDISVTSARIIATSFKIKDACAFVEDQYIQLGEVKAASVSIRIHNTEKVKYTSLRKTYNVLSSGGDFSNNNYTFHIDATKVVSLMQHLQE